ncbi:MAG: toll/interleukin-1 receptor domain-containing protein, partial [Gemmatimonadetes bacterium]|nr:toll/interleukin-1 receptor domain-containing protein [Gemmatimonadota bacterium]
MNLVYSYSHKDDHLREGIEKHLALLKAEGLIDEWYDRKILPGQAIHDEVDSNLETADLILLVLSPDFLASPECMRELRIALDLKAKNDALVVVPVIARPCAWKDLEGIS